MQLFFSYSHKDEDLRDQLETHLAVLKRQGVIETWHDRRIAPGDDFAAAIDGRIDTADVVLLLVSPDFLASDYCYEIEMRRALERHEAGQTRVIPVILRPCDWHTNLFGHLQAVPKDAKPITRWPDRDEAFLDVTKAIRALANSSPRTVDSVAPSQSPTARAIYGYGKASPTTIEICSSKRAMNFWLTSSKDPSTS